MTDHTPGPVRPDDRVTPLLLGTAVLSAAALLAGALLTGQPTARAVGAVFALVIGLMVGRVTVQAFHQDRAPDVPLMVASGLGLLVLMYTQRSMAATPNDQMNLLVPAAMQGALLVRVLLLRRGDLTWIDKGFALMLLISAVLNPVTFGVPALAVLAAFLYIPRLDQKA